MRPAWRLSRLQYAMAGPHPWCRGDLHAHKLEHDGAFHANRATLPGLKHCCGNQRQREFESDRLSGARGRAGYVIGNFLPYGFIGMAVGRASYSIATAAALQQNSAAMVLCRAIQTSLQRVKTSSFSTAPDKTTPCSGATRSAPDSIGRSRPTSSLRGEFEFVQFAPISDIAVSVSSGRVGAGFKF